MIWLNWRAYERAAWAALVVGLTLALLASHGHVLRLKAAALESENRALAAVAKAEAAARVKEQQLRERAAQVEADHVAALQDRDRALAAALGRLRNAEAAAARKPAAAAPAACGSYDAPPAQLSQSDREFLVRLGDEADRVVDQLSACQAFIREIVGTH